MKNIKFYLKSQSFTVIHSLSRPWRQTQSSEKPWIVGWPTINKAFSTWVQPKQAPVAKAVEEILEIIESIWIKAWFLRTLLLEALFNRNCLKKVRMMNWANRILHPHLLESSFLVFSMAIYAWRETRHTRSLERDKSKKLWWCKAVSFSARGRRKLVE